MPHDPHFFFCINMLLRKKMRFHTVQTVKAKIIKIRAQLFKANDVVS